MDKEKIKTTAMELWARLKIKTQELYAKAVIFCKQHMQFSISMGIILAGILLAVLMTISRSKPKKAAFPELAPLVKTQVLERCDIPMIIRGYGTVKPKIEVQIVPQVSGKVVSVHPEFRAGGFITAKEALFQIEPKDFALAVEQAQAKVAEMEVKLDMEKSEAAVAVREWQQINPGTEPDSALVLRQPQIRQASAALDSAKAVLAKAKLDLERTNIVLPLDVYVTAKSVDLGQFITAGQNAGSAYGVDAVEIEVPLEDSELAWFNLPDEAQVKTNFAGTEKVFGGIVKRTTAKVDESSRLVYVVVEVENPTGQKSSAQTLIPGMFVAVDMKGKVLENAFAVKRDWVHNGDELWIVGDGVLNIKPANVVRTDEKYAYIKIDDADKIEIITSNVDAVVDGMKVRIASDK